MHSVGSYKFLKFIRTGSYCGVWECQDIRTGDLRACKVIDIGLCSDDEFFDHFKNELIIHSQISHESIVKLYDVIIDDKNVYIVIELCDGGDLNDHVQRLGGLPENQARRYFKQLMGAVSYIHKLGVAHRDIKLENILVTSQDTAKLTDFGLCKQQSGNNLLLTTCGTLVYAAPEIIKEQPYNGMTADIWSAGVVLYAMISNHFPWQVEEEIPAEDLVHETANQILSGTILYPDTISFELLNLLENMLNVDPEERPQAHEIMDHPWMKMNTQEMEDAPPIIDQCLIETVKNVITVLDKRRKQ